MPGGSSENMEVWRSLIEAFNERGVEAAMEYFAPDAEVYDPDLPGAPLRGHDQIRSVMEGLMSGYEEFEVKDFELIGAGDRVIGLIHTRGRGSGSLGETEVEVRDAHVMTFREGKISYWRLYTSQEEALADAGLPPRAGRGS